jgi:predicted CopG family antitoxin
MRESLKRLVHRRIHMGTKSVRLDDDVYERVKAHKREDETFSDAVARLIEDVSLLDLADEGEEYDAERAAEQKEALKRTARADAESAAKLDEKGS